MWYLSKKRENRSMKWKRKPGQGKKTHADEGSLRVSGKGPTVECMWLKLSCLYTKKKKVQLFQPYFINKLKTQM